MRDLHAQRIGQAHPHGAQTAGIDPAARLIEFVELRGPHLVLAHVGGDISIALGHLEELFDDELRLDDGAVAIVLEAVAASSTPRSAPTRLSVLRHPGGRARRRVGDSAPAARHAHRRRWGYRPSRAWRSTTDRRRCARSADRSWLKCFGLPITRSSKRAPIATSTSQCCMAMFDSNVPCMPSMPVNCGSVRREAAETHQRIGARIAERAHELRELHGSIAEDPPPPRRHRALGLEQVSCKAFLICPAWPFTTGLYERRLDDPG